MKFRNVLLSVSVAALLSSLVVNAASLSVNGSAAIEGNYGLEVIMNDTSSAYVMDDSPINETTYRAQFMLDWNTLQFATNSGPGSNMAILKLFDMDVPGPLPRQHVIVGLRLGGDGVPKVFLKLIQYDGITSWPIWRDHLGSPLELNLPTTAGGYPCGIRVEFQQGTTGSPADGVVRFARYNAYAPGVWNSKENSEVVNYLLDVDSAYLGAMAADATSTGSFYLDSFESYRTLAP